MVTSFFEVVFLKFLSTQAPEIWKTKYNIKTVKAKNHTIHDHALPDNSKDFGTTHFGMEMAIINSIYIKKTEQSETDAT